MLITEALPQTSLPPIKLTMHLHFDAVSSVFSRLVFVLATLFLLGINPGAVAQGRPNPDEQIIARAKLVAAGELVELYQGGVPVDPAFLAALENTYRRIEKLLGYPLDKASLGEKIRVYVTDAAHVSHVWRRYEHQREPRGIVILSKQAYFGGLRSENATYAHERGHLFT